MDCMEDFSEIDGYLDPSQLFLFLLSVDLAIVPEIAVLLRLHSIWAVVSGLLLSLFDRTCLRGLLNPSSVGRSFVYILLGQWYQV